MSFFFLEFLSFLWIGAQFPQEKFLSYGRILTLDFHFLIMCILMSYLSSYLILSPLVPWKRRDKIIEEIKRPRDLEYDFIFWEGVWIRSVSRICNQWSSYPRLHFSYYLLSCLLVCYRSLINNFITLAILCDPLMINK